MTHPFRAPARALVVAALALTLASAAPARAGDASAEARTLIQAMWDTVVPILANKGMDKDAREARFGIIYRTHFDNAGIAAAVVGPAVWLQASPQQRARFLQQFEVYVVKVYAGQFATYNGEQLVVRHSEPDGEGAMVTTEIVDPAAPGKRTLAIKWRLRPTAEGLKVRDVLFENISMTLNQRREFAAVMRQRGGTLDGLTAALSEKIAQLDRKN